MLRRQCDAARSGASLANVEKLPLFLGFQPFLPGRDHALHQADQSFVKLDRRGSHHTNVIPVHRFQPFAVKMRILPPRRSMRLAISPVSSPFFSTL